MREKMLHTSARMTVAAYARHRKVSRRAVYDALAQGRIARLPGGMIDPVAADRAWRVNTLPHVGGKPRPKGNAADRRAVETGEAEGRRLLGVGAGRVLSFNDARRGRELVKLSREALALRKLRGETVDLKDAQRRAFHFARMWRDRMDAAVSREAPIMAADLGVEEGAMWRRLKRFMTGLQEELATMDVGEALATDPAEDEEEADVRDRTAGSDGH